MSTVSDLLTQQVKLQCQQFNLVRQQYNSSAQDGLSQLITISEMLKNNKIKIKFGDADTKASSPEQAYIQSDTSSYDNNSDIQEEKKNKKSRKNNKKPILEAKDTEATLSDSNSSTRSQRAAAQAVGQKMAEVQKFLKAKKLRRPTDFDERQRRCGKAAASPPFKSRKTYQQQSAGSSLDSNENGDDDNKENNFYVKSEVRTIDKNIVGIHSSDYADICLKNRCTVSINKLTNSTIKSHVRNRSLESLLHKNADTIIKDNSFSKKINLKEGSKTYVLEKSIKSTEDLFQLDLECSLVDKSLGSESQFVGFDLEDKAVELNTQVLDTIVKEINSNSEVNELQINAFKQSILNKTISALKVEETTEIEQIQRLIPVTKDSINMKIVDEANEVVLNENIYETEKKKDISSDDEHVQQLVQHDGNRAETQDCARNGAVNTLEERMDVNEDSDDECESDREESEVRSRTRVIKKHSDVPENECRSRTKTIRKKTLHNDSESTSVAVVPKEHLLGEEKKLTPAASTASPVVGTKGTIVRKRVEEFENLEKNIKETTGMVTRHTAKTQNRYLPPKAVPQGIPALTKAHQVKKKINSATTPVPAEHVKSVVQKQQALEEIEKKKKEEERLKRQAKEEIAIKKKEKALKATVEIAKRKREEKLKKAAAVREAAEREKSALSRKAEKEKEAKMQQIAAEKEKYKEEQLKIKQLTKQKALEHDERRKQEEEARLARLKEQEEEHKRILAMRERELEQKKQVKDNEIRMAENEKAKQKATKVCKVVPATSSNSKWLQELNPVYQQPVTSYEITPAREDRPLLESKSENDYGIDHAISGDDSSEDETQPKKKIPLWADAKRRYRLLKVNSYLPSEIWPLFMDCSANPDVNKIFTGNPIKKRVRTSSAVWNTPPNYSSHFLPN